MLEQLRDSLFKWISQGKTNYAIKELIDHENQLDDHARSKLALLSGNYKRLLKSKKLGTISAENFEVENNRINAALLDLVNALAAEDIVQGFGKSVKRKFFIAILLGLLIILSYLLLFNQYYPNDIETRETQFEDNKGNIDPTKQPIENSSLSLGNKSLPEQTDSKQNNSFKEKQIKLEKTHYDVSLVLPSRMKNALITVDGKPAIILSSDPIVTKVRLVSKDSNHEIRVHKEGYTDCNLTILVEKDGMVLKPCQ